MTIKMRIKSLALPGLVGLGLAVAAAGSPAEAQSFGVTSLVTDDQSYLTSQGYGAAVTVDPALVNPWGMDRSPTGAWFIANTGSEAATTAGAGAYYNGAGKAAGPTVSIPQGYDPPNGATGVVYNPYAGAFTLPEGAASQFLVSDLDGSISGVAAGATTAVKVIQGVTPPPVPPGVMAPDHSVYTGLTVGADGSNDYIYAANNRTGGVDVYNSRFQAVNLGATAFTDPDTAGLAAYNAVNIKGDIWVTYAIPGPSSARAGLDSGVVAEYSASGALILSIKDPHMSSPWALALAPSSFGAYAGDLLEGNFSHDDVVDGVQQKDAFINVFNPTTGAYVGALDDSSGKPILLPGLWQIEAGNGGAAGSSSDLYFSAGIGDEQHGLFGYISAAPEPSTWSLMILGVGLLGTALRRHRRPGPAGAAAS